VNAARPNVVLVILDAARRDALEPYGAPAGATPALAQLASRGTALEDVHATGCWTVPSHGSFFTGLLPRAAGLSMVPAPSASRSALEAHRDRLLPEILRRAGYATAAVSANLWLSEPSGFALGFDEHVLLDTDRHGQLSQGRGPHQRWRWVKEAALARVDDGARVAEETMTRWIERERERPFFWFVNLLDCHSPYLPPRPYGDVSTLDRIRAAEESRRYYTLEGIWRAAIGNLEVPEATLERMRALYAGAIRYLDDWVGRLLERLDASGVLDDTLVIVAADHGEMFGENGFIAHTHSLDERLIHVPFLVAGPGASGRSLHSLAELPRFVAEGVGLADHPWREELPPGVGVAQFDPPTSEDDPRVARAAEEWGWSDEQTRRFTTPLTCAVADGVKLLRRGDDEELYDLRADPQERSSVTPGAVDASLVERLRRALEHPAVVARAGSQPAAAEPSAEEMADIEERMRLLGYM